MPEIKEIMESIRAIECPTGELEKRVDNILKSKHIVNGDGTILKRNKQYDRDNAQGYVAKINGNKNLIILAEAGIDDYVACVTDVYIE